MIIGVCGKSGSGKSTLANEIIKVHEKQVIHCDIDKISHRILTYSQVQKELINNFGKEVVIDGKVDRKKLGGYVFNSKKEMDKLTDITWKHMEIEIDKFLDENKDKLIILDWILLPNTKYFEMCSLKILLDIPYEVRKARAIKRDSITETAFDLRDNASIEYDKNKFDYVINDETEVKRLVNIL